MSVLDRVDTENHPLIDGVDRVLGFALRLLAPVVVRGVRPRYDTYMSRAAESIELTNLRVESMLPAR